MAHHLLRPGRMLWAVSGLALAVLAAAQLALPGFVENRIAKGLRLSFDDVEIERAEVRAYPAYKLLSGRIDSVNLDLRRVASGGLTLDAVLVEGRNVKLDMRRLVSGEGVRVTAADVLRGTFVVAENDLNAYFASQSEEWGVFRIRLDSGRAVVSGNVNFLGRDLAVRVAGEFRVRGGTSILFVPAEVEVENTALPQPLLDLIAQGWAVSFDLDFDREAIPLVVEDVAVEDGRLFIYGNRPD